MTRDRLCPTCGASRRVKCGFCGSLIWTINPTQRYCDDQCRDDAYNKRRRDERRRYS